MDFEKFTLELKAAKNIVITTHYRPDGDAVGSSIALYHLLKKEGKNVKVIFPSGYANFLNWMPELDLNYVFSIENEPVIKNLAQNADIVFSLDYNSPERTNGLSDILYSSKATKVIIDHHPEPNTNYADFVFSDISYSSTCEMVYFFAKNCNLETKIDTIISNCLYAGIMTDTGRFKYATSARLMRVVAKLYELGLNDAFVIEKIFNSEPQNKLMFQAHCLLNRMKVNHKKGLALIYATDEDFKQFDYQPGFTEGLVNKPLEIEGVKISVFAAPAENFTKISFRSKGDFAVNEIASKYFSGGGHKNAAGGKFNETVKNTILQIEKVINQFN